MYSTMQDSNNQAEPLLSVFMVTYNHEKYIRQSLQSVIDQRTSFPIEVVIGEDCSTDGTRAIVREFEKKYPAIIKPIYHEKNVGPARNAYEFVYPRLRGKYVACLEGDDYWSDPSKLQRQVDFLENNRDYSICFHRVYEKFNSRGLIISPLNPWKDEMTFTIDDLAKGNFMHTLSVVFRNHCFDVLPTSFWNSPVQDYILHLLNALKGKIKYLPDLMAVYRRHNQGSFSLIGDVESHRKLSKTLSLLQECDFPSRIKLELLNQFYKVHEDYLLLMLKAEEYSKFQEEAKAYFSDNAERASEWVYRRVPDFFRAFTKSRTYIVSKRITAIVKKLKG